MKTDMLCRQAFRKVFQGVRPQVGQNPPRRLAYTKLGSGPNRPKEGWGSYRGDVKVGLILLGAAAGAGSAFGNNTNMGIMIIE